MAATFDTDLAPKSILKLLKQIEKEGGRKVGPRFGPRPIDIDLLLYGSEVVDRIGLRVPHPRMLRRGFVLEPLAEIAPDLIHPRSGQTILSLKEQVNGGC